MGYIRRCEDTGLICDHFFYIVFMYSHSFFYHYSVYTKKITKKLDVCNALTSHEFHQIIIKSSISNALSQYRGQGENLHLNLFTLLTSLVGSML